MTVIRAVRRWLAAFWNGPEVPRTVTLLVHELKHEREPRPGTTTSPPRSRTR